MKKIFALALFTLLALSACTKDEDLLFQLQEQKASHFRLLFL